MINLINADRVLKELYLSMLDKELAKANEQSKGAESKEQQEEEENGNT